MSPSARLLLQACCAMLPVAAAAMSSASFTAAMGTSTTPAVETTSATPAVETTSASASHVAVESAAVIH